MSVLTSCPVCGRSDLHHADVPADEYLGDEYAGQVIDQWYCFCGNGGSSVDEVQVAGITNKATGETVVTDLVSLEVFTIGPAQGGEAGPA